jgi:hypothetical protein
MKPADLPFNRVTVRSTSGELHYTVHEFERIPLTERVRALLEKRVEFFRDQQRIEQQAALRALRER